MEKVNQINLSKENIYRLDLYWSIFIATVNNSNQVWLPSDCPHLTEDSEEFFTLIEQLPAIDAFEIFLKYNSNDNKILDIFQWLINYIEKSIRADPINIHILSAALQTAGLTSYFKSPLNPTIIFRIIQISELGYWNQQADQFGTIFSYMPIQIEWLIKFLTGEHHTVLDEKIKIMNDLELAIKQTPINYSWGKSLMGGNLRIVAVVQVINHPSLKKKCKIIPRVNGFTEIFKNVDPDLILIRFLLIYSDKNININDNSKKTFVNCAFTSQRLQIVQVGCLLTMIFLFILFDISHHLVQ